MHNMKIRRNLAAFFVPLALLASVLLAPASAHAAVPAPNADETAIIYEQTDISKLYSNCTYSGTAEAPNGPLDKLLDNNIATYWHSEYGATATTPAEGLYAGPAPAQEVKPSQIPYGNMLVNKDQLNWNPFGDSDEGQVPQNLLDSNPETFWISNWHSGAPVVGGEYDFYDGKHYIEIDKFRDEDGNFSYNQGEATYGAAGDIIQVSQMYRKGYAESANSTDFLVCYRDPDTWQWHEAGHVKFKKGPLPGIGYGRMTVSNTIVMPAAYDAIRLVNCTARTDVGENTAALYSFHMAELRVKKVHEEVAEPVLKEVVYHTEAWNLDEISWLKGIYGAPNGIEYTLQHTKGFMDPKNHAFSYIEDKNTSVMYNKKVDQSTWYSDWATLNSTGMWNNEQLLKDNNIEPLDVSFLNVNGINRQRVHTVEHDVYVMPGQSPVLAPYSDFADQGAYRIALCRWYDWDTDKASPYLKFPYASDRMRPLESGDYAGYILFSNDDLASGTYYANTPVFWTDDENFKEATIAVDVAQETMMTHAHFDNDAKILYEPTLAIRHIFHVRNAKEQAEMISGSVEANRKFIEKNKHVISARAGKGFQISLDNPVPIIDHRSYSCYDMFYLDENGKVTRGHRPIIEVNGVRQPADAKGSFYTSQPYWGYGGHTVDMERYTISRLGQTGCEYDRFLQCDAANATEGTTRVRLLLTDKNGNVVNISGTEEPVVIAQYDITFLNSKAAILETEETVRGNAAYEYTSTKYLEKDLKLGDPVAKVDFDEYAALKDADGKYLSDYIFRYNADLHKVFYKWPRSWNQSSYCFGYSTRHDYNEYMLASHSEVTPYHGACDNAAYNKTRNQECGINGGGLYDRSFYDSEGQKPGFFYYVNAATDPGQLATMNIPDLCSGATLFVSGWMAEGSGGENENLIINFRAVMKGTGEKVILHSFVTGYLETTGVWNYFYYSFVPNLLLMGIDEKKIDHYELYVQNNCKSSGGADYYFDDIRVYVSKPRVYAAQATPICAGENSAVVRVRTPYEVMLSSNGLLEPAADKAGEKVDFYYTFVNKHKYDSIMSLEQGHVAAYEGAVIKDAYTNGTSTYGKISFNTKYESNPLLPVDNIQLSDQMGRDLVLGERNLVFNIEPKDKDFIVGAEYYMSVATSQDKTFTPGAADFDILGRCAKSCTLYFTASGVVRIDGEPVPDMSNITVCENQWPMVQIDIYKQDNKSDGVHKPTTTPLDKSAIIDWYDGPVSEYNKIKDPDGTLLVEALQHFRSVTDYRELDDPNQMAKGNFTDADRECLIHFTTFIDEEKKQRRPPLQLHRGSYIFPYLTVDDGLDSMAVYCTAIPIDRYNVAAPGILCTACSEIRVLVRNKSPFMRHGIRSTDLAYPKLMDDVPLRISLSDLQSVSGNIFNDEKDYIDRSRMLVVPIRETVAVTEGVTKFLLKGKDDFVYLVGTNDPDYKELGVPTDDPKGLRAIGRFRELTAFVDPAYGNLAHNNAHLQFRNDEHFRFHEGYYYKIRFDYQEDKQNQSNTLCDGQDVLTIKVVPEYAMFTGAAGNRNFNNDLNWRRVTSGELHGDPTGADADFVTDGTDKNTFSYAPIHTTQAIVDPQYKSILLNDVTPTTVHYTDVVTKNDITETWTRDITGENAEATTAEIQYDMVAQPHSAEDLAPVICRPWRANTCEDIHFNSGAVIHNHPALTYGHASVDFETRPDRWYTLASPLQAVYAGDMYLPTKGARQNTRLFTDINFKTELNDRFRPAVYQRSWNAGTANVYEFGASEVRNVAVRTVWSNVYNDVQVNYGGGHGFSVKTDVSKAGAKPEKVKFRLPKADTSYKYYSEDGSNVGNEQSVSRTNTGRLFPGEVKATLTGASDGKYFMAGNPYMAYLDVVKFLNGNAGLVKKIYILNGEGNADISVDASGNVTEAGTLNTGGLIPPMQGFFVVTDADKKSQEVTFNLSMIADDPATTAATPLHAPARSAVPMCLTVTASEGDSLLSSSIVRLDGAASADFRTDEDMELLLDGLNETPRVYTVAGTNAVTINTLPDIEKVEVGLADNDADRNVTLTFSGIDAVGPGLALYDAETGDVTPLEEGLAVKVRGAVANRLFIVSAAEDVDAVSTITVAVDGNEAVVSAAFTQEPLTVKAFDSVGREILSITDPSGTATFTLDRGVYIINAVSGMQRHTQKIALH